MPGPIKVIYYETERGDHPVREYLEALPDNERASTKALIDRLAEQATMREPYAKKLAGFSGLYELRPGKHRIFYCYHDGMVVLLHAFRKKSAKTPRREIETAYKRM